MHPTVKPTAMVADAIRDCSRRGETVLDIFGGSGSTLLAAETCGRQARILELDPGYCDTIITRWETYTGKKATLDVQDAALRTSRSSVRAERRLPKLSGKSPEEKQQVAGYRVPPTHSQFKRGQSGNPKVDRKSLPKFNWPDKCR